MSGIQENPHRSHLNARGFIICWVVTSVKAEKNLKDTSFPRDVITRGKNKPGALGMP